MNALRIALLTTAVSWPAVAFAQQMDPNMPMPGMEARPPSKAAQGVARARTAGGANTHARQGGHAKSMRRAKAAQPRRGMAAMPPSTDPDPAQQMAGRAGGKQEMPNASPPPAALSGPAHAADLVYGPSDMARAREGLRAEQGDIKAYRVLVDRFETQFQKGGNGYNWDAQAWYGGDINKLWVKTEGNGAYRGKLDQGEVQALWSRAISPWFDLQAGARVNFGPGPQRTDAVLALQGLMPYAYNVEASLFLSNKGELRSRLEAEYDLLITQRLILQPRAEVNLSAQNIPELGIGAGLSTIEAGLRLRYEFIPEFAPYVGMEYERKVGNTASFARANGQGADSLRYVVGLRSWF